MRFALIALMLATAGCCPRPAHGAEHPIEADTLRLRDPINPVFRRVRFRAVRENTLPPSLADDPRVSGATVEIAGANPGDGTSGVITLAPGLWTGLGTPPGATGFRYYDPLVTTGIRTVVFRLTPYGVRLVVRGRGSNWPYAIAQAQGPIRVRFAVGDELYCAEVTT